MKKLIIATLTVFLFSTSYAQQTGGLLEQPHISVNGTHEMEVMPDEIYVSITIHERVKGKEKITVQEQEKKLKEGFAKAGINLDELSLSSANSNYVKVKWSKKDVLARKSYSLKLATAEQVGQVFKVLDEVDIQSGYIERVDHSDMINLRKQARIEAIKAAQDKANYLLNAIGQRPGKAIQVSEEIPNTITRIPSVAGQANTMQYSAYSYDKSYEKTEIGFKKITIKMSVFVVFLIEG